MNREPIIILPYDSIDFVWISNHWDIHLNGTCFYDEELCEFETNTTYNKEQNEWEPITVKIYQLTLEQKLVWIKSQADFEKGCGYHWTYKYGKLIR